MPEQSKTYVMGPLFKPMIVEEFLLIEQKQMLAEQVAEDAERLRKWLEEDPSA